MTRKTSFACCIVASIFASMALWHSFEWLCTEYDNDSTCFGPAGYMQRDLQLKFDFGDTQQFPQLCPTPGNASLDFWLQRHKLCTTAQAEYVRPQESYVCLWMAWMGLLGSFICGVWGLFFPLKLPMVPVALLFCSTICFSISVHTFLDWDLVDDFLQVGGGGFAFFKHAETQQLYVPGGLMAIEMTCTHYLAMLICALGIDMFSLIALLVTR